MTAFALTAGQQDFVREVTAVAAEELRPLAAAGAPGHVNRELVKAMGRLGLLARLFPQGGLGGRAVPPSAGGSPGGSSPRG
jgi:acyl-CoA dehydrogenase